MIALALSVDIKLTDKRGISTNSPIVVWKSYEMMEMLSIHYSHLFVQRIPAQNMYMPQTSSMPQQNPAAYQTSVNMPQNPENSPSHPENPQINATPQMTGYQPPVMQMPTQKKQTAYFILLGIAAILFVVALNIPLVPEHSRDTAILDVVTGAVRRYSSQALTIWLSIAIPAVSLLILFLRKIFNTLILNIAGGAYICCMVFFALSPFKYVGVFVQSSDAFNFLTRLVDSVRGFGLPELIAFASLVLVASALYQLNKR